MTHARFDQQGPTPAHYSGCTNSSGLPQGLADQQLPRNDGLGAKTHEKCQRMKPRYGESIRHRMREPHPEKHDASNRRDGIGDTSRLPQALAKIGS